MQFGYLQHQGDRQQLICSTHTHTLSEPDSHTVQQHAALLFFLAMSAAVLLWHCGSETHVGFLIVCRGLCNCRTEKPHSKRCGIISSVLPRPLPDLLLLLQTSTLYKYLRCTYIDLHSLPVSLSCEETSRVDWDGLQKYETQIHLFCLNR